MATIIPPTIPDKIPEKIGTPQANEIPKHNGRATKKTTTPDLKSEKLNFEFIFN